MSVNSFLSWFTKSPVEPPAQPNPEPPPKLPFEQLAEDMLERLKIWEAIPPLPRRAQAVGVLVTCWQQTAVPFFSLELASCFKQQGFDVTLIFDLVDLGLRADSHFPIEQRTIAALIPEYEKHFKVIRMNERTDPAEEPTSDEAFLERLLFENFCAVLRGETAAQQFLTEKTSLLPIWKRHAALLRTVLSQEAKPWSWLLIPGGIYSVSGIYLHILRQLGVPFYTYDSGAGLLAVAGNGVTSYLNEVPVAAGVLESELSEEDWQVLEAETSRQMEFRRSGKDSYVRQPAPVAENPDAGSDLLLFLNCRADNAAMERQLAFRNVEDWLREVVAWAGKKNLRLIVRQHPSEARDIFRGSDDYAAVIDAVDPQRKTTTFVAAADPINSYTLLQHTRVVLPYTSRVGVEAALMGRPVVLGSRSYYAEMAFVQQERDPAAYFARIEEALATPPTLTPHALRQARLVYYLIENCFFLHTPLTPVIDDCLIWIKEPPQTFWAAEAQQDLLKVFLSKQSLFEVLFRRRFRNPATTTDSPAEKAA